MKATDAFTETISNHLAGVALNDPLFAETLKKPAKNIKDCINYIFTTVQKSGKNGFADEEIFGMAVHYYDEDNIKTGKPANCNVVVNHSIKSDKKEVTAPIPEKAKPTKKVKKEQLSIIQTSLFG